MPRSSALAGLLVVVTTALLALLFFAAFLYAPEAQAAAGGAAQRIFYFHVPSAYALYLCGTVCCVASAAYLVRPTPTRDAWARAGAECAVLFGLAVMTSGPLWAKKAWGVYWTAEPRLTTLLLAFVIFAALGLLRAFAGDGEAERRFAAAFGVLGTVNLPIIHLSVRLWGGNHPTVIGRGGGGLAREMGQVLGLGFLAMTLLAGLLLWLRARNALLLSQLNDAEERVAALEAPQESQ